MSLNGLTTILIILGLCLLSTITVFWLRREKKSAAERERERRLTLHATGRLTEGLLTDGDPSSSEYPSGQLLFYRYRAAGVEYSAAQDVSFLQHLIPAGNCAPGKPAVIKYDPHNPSNSIVVCELWSGLPTAQRNPDNARQPHSTPRRETTPVP